MKYLVVVFFWCCVLKGFSQKKTYVNQWDTLESGTVVYKHIKISEPKKFKLHDYYKITETHVEYRNKSGKIICKQYILQRTGVDALPCNELLFIQQDYFTNGKLKSYWKIKCDCHKVWRKEYNSKGQLLNKQYMLIKRHY